MANRFLEDPNNPGNCFFNWVPSNVVFNKITAQSLTGPNIQVDLTNITCTNETVINLTGTNAIFTSLTGTNLNASNAVIPNLTGTNINVPNINFINGGFTGTNGNLINLSVSTTTGTSISMLNGTLTNGQFTNITGTNGSNLISFPNNLRINTNNSLGFGSSNTTSLSGNMILGNNPTIVSSTGMILLGNNNTVINEPISNSVVLGNNSQVGQGNMMILGNSLNTNVLPGTGSSLNLGIGYQPFVRVFTKSINTNVAGTGGNYSASSTDSVVNITGNFTLTLPTAFGNNGQIITVNNVGTANISVALSGADKFNATGSSAVTIAKFQTQSFISDGGNGSSNSLATGWWLM